MLTSKTPLLGGVGSRGLVSPAMRTGRGRRAICRRVPEDEWAHCSRSVSHHTCARSGDETRGDDERGRVLTLSRELAGSLAGRTPIAPTKSKIDRVREGITDSQAAESDAGGTTTLRTS